ncbi:hypothetical protein CHS0354_021789 [Potamilus streckersoni]|uniref:Apple domain-containing protein n=1 Tax=Potamilus streckersoni TaxID=2493646 RepID=A0AAE0S3Y6_9BIVA|nr:hypothetical protein CHS0354_021789 [Potamilus streckersoni]
MDTETRASNNIRNYLDDYTQAPGTMVLLSGDQEVSGITSANDCGSACSSYTSFSCKAFQYCPNGNRCLLFKTHNVNNKPDGTSPSAAQCYFYSRSHISDFTMINGRSLVFGSSVVEFYSISLDECANTCVEQKDLGCKGFYYCGNTTMCRLTSGKPGSGDVNTSNSGDYCAFYARQYFPSGSSHPLLTSPLPNPPSVASTNIRSVTSASICVTTAQSSGKTQSGTLRPEDQRTVYRDKIDTGSIIGVAFGLFIAGLLTGTAATHFRRRWKEKGTKYQAWQSDIDT